MNIIENKPEGDPKIKSPNSYATGRTFGFSVKQPMNTFRENNAWLNFVLVQEQLQLNWMS